MYNSIRQYFKFLLAHRSTYVRFNRQLLIGELAGFGAGVVVAEVAASLTADEFSISAYSSGADYMGSILGFLAVFYHDNRSSYRNDSRSARTKKILKDALKLWPSVLAADIAFILVRPYFHYISLTLGVEAGVAATVAHFLAFGVFNGVAILSRSLIDYARSTKQ
ncbi:MAG TPA: hypothetical protein VIE86_06655 [Nitrososphaera sp.]|jgi:hypothetical protein